jgi:hypothetical protein
MAMRKRITSNIPITCLVIMILCLLTAIDDISGCWQPLTTTVPIIQSGSSQDDDGDGHIVNSVCNLSTWGGAIDVTQRFSFSQAYLEEIKWQVSLIYLSSSHNRAPPSFS